MRSLAYEIFILLISLLSIGNMVALLVITRDRGSALENRAQCHA